MQLREAISQRRTWCPSTFEAITHTHTNANANSKDCRKDWRKVERGDSPSGCLHNFWRTFVRTSAACIRRIDPRQRQLTTICEIANAAQWRIINKIAEIAAHIMCSFTFRCASSFRCFFFSISCFLLTQISAQICVGPSSPCWLSWKYYAYDMADASECGSQVLFTFEGAVLHRNRAILERRRLICGASSQDSSLLTLCRCLLYKLIKRC